MCHLVHSVVENILRPMLILSPSIRGLYAVWPATQLRLILAQTIALLWQVSMADSGNPTLRSLRVNRSLQKALQNLTEAYVGELGIPG